MMPGYLKKGTLKSYRQYKSVEFLLWNWKMIFFHGNLIGMNGFFDVENGFIPCFTLAYAPRKAGAFRHPVVVLTRIDDHLAHRSLFSLTITNLIRIFNHSSSACGAGPLTCGNIQIRRLESRRHTIKPQTAARSRERGASPKGGTPSLHTAGGGCATLGTLRGGESRDAVRHFKGHIMSLSLI